ncbi:MULTISPECIES: orotate phosphoribosyltransferase [unclassified Thermosipho (in: thermotogales)]|uniref:orotate phosphoribosyltransferase n=1 Tax=unclassified Thermosipho (in: thermotogales) TaxID=2676525 RepID=UPI000987244B|nr:MULTISPECIES: orotate phosphoribosyltransferase [unclassified Thermosipho (in: thermotogales)]MBT1248515.1 orotate phosphoribosyltransferase [Thermosipho sp. 1244]OOC47284.1 orotate phosphoribosyltransferase [Thermosipho sp. 1223]
MKIEEILEKTGALLNGHFILSSGNHSEKYIQCARIFEYPKYGELVGKMLAEKLEKYNPDLIIGPTMGGIHIAYIVAKYLNKRNIFAERENKKMTLRRGFKINEGEKVAIVEDVITTGKSVKEVIEIVKENNGKVCCIGSIINRSDNNPFEVPYEYLLKINIPIYKKEECPLCKEQIPAEKPGSRFIK